MLRYSRCIKFSNFRLRRHRINISSNNKNRTMYNAFTSSFNKNKDRIKHNLSRCIGRSYAISDYTNFSSSFTKIVQDNDLCCCENYETSTLLHRTKQLMKMEYLKGGNL